MKKIVIALITICISSLAFSQIKDCPPLANGILMNGTVPVEYIPADFTDDTWGTPSLDEDRLIIWVHGLSGQGDDAGGTEISWLKASTQTELDYKVNSRRPDYNDAGLFEAAAELKGDIEIEYGDDVDEATFIIAHSQGGIVSRRIDYAYETGELGTEPRTFHGLVTFGSPHQGARIINNIEQFYPWVEEGCDDLSDGPQTEFETLTVFGELLSLFVNLEGFTDFLCYDLSDELIKRVSEDLAAPIGSDYAVGAEELNTLNSFLPSIPYVVFYGEETEPLMWNTLVHVLDGHLPNDFDPFMANNDETLTDDVSEIQSEYYAKYKTWDEEADYWESILDEPGDFLCFLYLLIGSPEMLIACLGAEAAADYDEAIANRDAWKRGYDWWTDANPTWKSIIGVDTYVAGEEWSCNCLHESDFDLTMTSYPIDPGEECNEEWGDCWVSMTYTIEQKPSDGVVLAESAGYCLGMTFNAKMTDSNHFSMRNDHNTEDRLKELFEGNYGDYFKTQKR